MKPSNVNYNDKSDVVTIESQIQLKILEKAYEKMTNEERSELLRTFGENLSIYQLRSTLQS